MDYLDILVSIKKDAAKKPRDVNIEYAFTFDDFAGGKYLYIIGEADKRAVHFIGGFREETISKDFREVARKYFNKSSLTDELNSRTYDSSHYNEISISAVIQALDTRIYLLGKEDGIPHIVYSRLDGGSDKPANQIKCKLAMLKMAECNKVIFNLESSEVSSFDDVERFISKMSNMCSLEEPIIQLNTAIDLF